MTSARTKKKGAQRPSKYTSPLNVHSKYYWKFNDDHLDFAEIDVWRILNSEKVWKNGSILGVYFHQRHRFNAQFRIQIQRYISSWARHANIKFDFKCKVEQAHIWILLNYDGNNESYIVTDSWLIEVTKPTISLDVKTDDVKSNVLHSDRFGLEKQIRRLPSMLLTY